MNILVIEGSTRTPSSTLAHVEELLASQNASRTRIVRLSNQTIPPFADARTFGVWQTNSALEQLLDQLLDCDLLILASPLYWYSVSGPMKNFIDHWSYFMRVPRSRERQFLKDKWIFPLIVASEGATSEEINPAFDMLRLSAKYVEARYLPGFSGEGDRDGQAAAGSLERIRGINLQLVIDGHRHLSSVSSLPTD